MSALPANTSTTAVIDVNGPNGRGAASFSAGLASATDRDWIAVDLASGRSYNFYAALTGSGAKVSFTLRDSNGDVVASSSMFQASGNSYLKTGHIYDAGTYYIDIGSANGVIGDYELVAADASAGDLTSTYRGTTGDDDFYAYAPTQVKLGLEGNDYIIGGGLVLGQQGNDDLTAASGNSYLFGGAGNDRLAAASGQALGTFDGGRGVDRFFATLGDDLIIMDGAGIDTPSLRLIDVEQVYSGDGADVIEANDRNNAIYGGDGDDVVNARGGTDTVRGDGGDDILTGGDGDDTLDGGSGADQLDGGTGADILLGGAGDDILIGGEGADYLVGGAGADVINGDAPGTTILWYGDTLSYAASTAAVSVDLVAGTASGGDAEGDQISNIENVIGSAFDDHIVLANRTGTKVIGGAGADILVGAGADGYSSAVSYEGSTVGVDLNFMTGVFSGGDAEGDQLSFFKEVFGSAGDDRIVGKVTFSPYSGEILLSHRLYGGDGDDYLFNTPSAHGGAGDDIITGSDGSDFYLDGDAGHDTISGGYGDDVIYLSAVAADADHVDGGVGEEDLIRYHGDVGVTVDLINGIDSAGNTMVNIEDVYGSAGDDVVISASRGGHFTGGDGYDILDLSQATSGALSDLRRTGFEELWLGDTADTYNIPLANSSLVVLRGGGGDDRLTSFRSGSTLDGEAGNDVLIASQYSETMIGGSGADTVQFGGSTAVRVDLAYNVSSGGNAHNDVLIGVENLTGGSGDDRLYGDGGANVLTGSSGDDVLVGRGGADRLVGGSGTDWFVYSATTQSTVIERDTIADFSQADHDRIDLRAFDGDLDTAGHQGLHFIGGDAFSGTHGEIRAIAGPTSGSTIIQIDTDGNGVTEMEILVRIMSPGSFSAADFIL